MLFYIRNDSIVLLFDYRDKSPEIFTINKDNYKYNKILDKIKNGTNDDEIIKILKDETEIRSYIEKLTIFDGVEIIKDEDGINVKIDGEIINKELAELIINHYNAGIDFKHFIRFFKKLRENPSKNVYNQLCGFIASSMKYGGFIIHEDGDIIAYKRVRNDYKDIYSGVFDNSIGSIVKMKREAVCEDPKITCSNGLHFCSFSYLSEYASFEAENDRVVIVKINPKNVVSIPVDYGYAKARCCEYKVIGELENIKKPLPDQMIYNEKSENICKDNKDSDSFITKNENIFNSDLYDYNYLYNKIFNSDLYKYDDLYKKILNKFIKIQTLKEKRDFYCDKIDKNANFKKFRSHSDSKRKCMNFLNNCDLNKLIEIYNNF